MPTLRPNDRPEKIGIITHGSLNKGVEMKLDPAESIESVVAGTFVVIQGQRYDFFSMITDVTIDAANEDILLHPPPVRAHLLRRILQGTGTYATVTLRPMLMMENRVNAEFAEVRPVKTVPAHFSVVARATEEDVARVFGHEANRDDEGRQVYFHIGEPLGMDGIPVCLDLQRFVERSNAVFGKTGTGKTFITRLLLAGTIQTGRAVNLIFDMHSEYGLSARKEGGGFVRGLRDLFPAQVQIFSLDPAGTRTAHRRLARLRGLPLRRPDRTGRHPPAPRHAQPDGHRRREHLRPPAPLRPAMADDPSRRRPGRHRRSVRGARERRRRAATQAPRLREATSFFRTEPSAGRQDVIEDLMETLDAGKSVVFEFGKFDDLRVYLLVANVITRRLRDRYEEKTLHYLQTRNEADAPRPLIITIEEAHKFLAPGIAHETPFGKIAREMRKFFVSLLVVDQRPSAIDEEVLSQIGTKIIAQLNDEKDIGAALVGVSGASSLRQVLASLDSRQQALVLGHAVPMPVVIRTRSYDEAFYRALRGDDAPRSFKEARSEISDLF
ncbi:MAG: hypothetical protein KatS3mg043_0100 [Rhodothermaceae bacterium]|nr:MAG: hypothetical protein KatS3mg043_0100 [Rhodothermaceae bacterium]